MARKMKDSGIEWIGEIPEGWEIVKIKYGVTKVGSGKTPSGGAEVYTDCGVLFLRSQNIYDCSLVLDNPSYISYETDLTMKSTRILPNDILLNITGASIGRCCVVPETLGPANVNQHVCIIRTNPEFFLPKFMQYFWVSHLGRYAISLFQTGGNREGLSFDAIRNTPIPYISIPEQSKIITYLDSECSRIDVMFSKTRSSIEEYKKLKQAVITQAVTKGVRGEHEMKDSGVEWAGLVPHHWGVAKIGSIGQTSNGATPLRSKESSFFDDATIRWVRTLDLNDGFVYDSSEKITELALASSACSIMPKGTVCVAMYGGAGTIGKCGLLMSDCATNQAVCSIVCNRKIVSPIFLLMQLLALKSYWMKYAVGTRKDPNISQDVVARMKILIPPLDEQREITDYLDAKCAEIDKLIAKKEQLVKELESYKKSLIYEVVTGKREV